MKQTLLIEGNTWEDTAMCFNEKFVHMGYVIQKQDVFKNQIIAIRHIPNPINGEVMASRFIQRGNRSEIFFDCINFVNNN
jgi:hypothetical protein